MSEMKKQSQCAVTEAMMEELRHEFRSLTVDQVADVMGLERWRVYELVKQGKAPPHFRVGAIYRFPLNQFRAWMAETMLSS